MSNCVFFLISTVAILYNGRNLFYDPKRSKKHMALLLRQSPIFHADSHMYKPRNISKSFTVPI